MHAHLASLRAMMRDERYFKEPHIFNPDRFLSKADMASEEGEVKSNPLKTFKPDDPTSLSFGFGRR